jgi:hypothetical protein
MEITVAVRLSDATTRATGETEKLPSGHGETTERSAVLKPAKNKISGKRNQEEKISLYIFQHYYES